MALRKLSQTLKITLALMLSVFSTGILPTATAYAATQPWSEPTNHEEYWEALNYGTCTKTDYPASPEVTNYTMPTAPSGNAWSLLVIKGAQFNEVYENPTVGQTYNSTFDTKNDANPNNDKYVGISHIIVCYKPTTNPVTAGVVTYVDLCGTTNDTYTVPITPNVTYSVAPGTYPGIDTVTVTATADSGYVLTAPYTFTHTFTDEACPLIPVTAGVVTYSDVCGTTNDTFTVPTTPNVTYSVAPGTHAGVGTVTVTATANAGYVLTAPYTFTHTFTNDVCPIEANPTAPSKDDVCEFEDDTFTIPSTTGVEYRVNGNVVTAGDHSTNGAQSVTVTAHALTGYVLTGTTSWTLTFTGDECENEVIDVCPNTPELDLIIPNGLVKDDNGNCVTDQCPLVPGVQTDTTLCPPGQGGGTPTTPGQTLGTSTTTTPQVLSTSTELPATLPATGGSSNPFMIVLASILAYGVAYFLQGRRQLAREQA